jgi:hypothetical protein
MFGGLRRRSHGNHTNVAGNDPAAALTVTAEVVRNATVLHTRGVLEDSTYVVLRDKIIDAALDEPRAVVIDVTELRVPAESALSVFSSARWIVSRWPEVPIALVCEHIAGRDALARSTIAKLVPVFPTIDSALDALPLPATHQNRRRAQAELPASPDSLRRSRELAEEWLTAWSQTDLIPVTKVVITAFVENVLQHTDSRPRVRLESDGATVTVAVEDRSNSPAVVREGEWAKNAPSGLLIVAALCRAWGNAPTPAGKTVWAVIGPENRL